VIGCIFIRDVTFFPEPDLWSAALPHADGSRCGSRIQSHVALAPQRAGLRQPEACAQPARKQAFKAVVGDAYSSIFWAADTLSADSHQRTGRLGCPGCKGRGSLAPADSARPFSQLAESTKP
jgi:hypothetical protein